VEVCASAEALERGGRGRATATETFAFLPKRIAFLSRCTNNTCHGRLLLCAAILKELEGELRRVLQQGTENIHRGQVKFCYAPAAPELQSDGLAASDVNCNSKQIARV